LTAFELEEVIVTAQKRAQSVNDVGMSINAFSGDTLNELGVEDTADLATPFPIMTLGPLMDVNRVNGMPATYGVTFNYSWF
jgi:iron complex outermembrane receptor protein